MKKGDRVSYVVTKKIGYGRFSSSAREGVVEVWSEPFCSVRAKNGKILVVRAALVTPAGEKNAITKILEKGLKDGS